VNNEADLKQK